MIGAAPQALRAQDVVERRCLLIRGTSMTQDSKDRVYALDEINARLERELPHWHYENGWIRRTFRTTSWKGTLMVINAVGHLAEAAWHHPDLRASYAFVEVKLQTHSAKGITDKDFELARKIEDFVSWRPGKEGGALEGTPTGDQRFAYIKYDDK
jgi:4a-hydroxytetrahydrobiopterin dehydratase